MSEFKAGASGEYDKQQNAAVALVRRVNEVLIENQRTLSLEIRDLESSRPTDMNPRHDELVRMSARNHLNCLAAFYKRIYPETVSIRIEDGVHSALPLRDAVTGHNLMLLATTLILPEECSLQAVTVSLRDEYLVTSSTIYMNDDGRFEAVSAMKPKDDGLIMEAIQLVGMGRRDMVIPVLSAVIDPDEVTAYLDALRPVVAEQYDEAETERFLADVRNRYDESRRADETVKQLGLLGMSSVEIEDVLTALEPIDRWS